MPLLPVTRKSPLLSDLLFHAFKSSSSQAALPWVPLPHLLCLSFQPRQAVLRWLTVRGGGAGLVGNGETWGAAVGFLVPLFPGVGHEAPALILSPVASSPLIALPPTAHPTSEALVGVTGRLNRTLGISSLGRYYTGMFTESQLPGK